MTKSKTRLGQSAFSAAKWMTGSSYITFVAGFVGNVFVTRGLGPESYGIYSYLIWMISVAITLIGGGFNITAIRFISEEVGRQDLSQAARVHGRLRQGMWTATAVAAVLLMLTATVPGVYPEGLHGHLWLFLVFVVVCGAAKTGYLFEMSVSKGYSIFQTEAMTTSLLGLIGALGAYLLFLLDQGLAAYLILFLVITLAHPVMANWIMRGRNIQSDSGPLSPELTQRLWQGLKWNSTLSVVSIFTSKSIDTYVLGLTEKTVYVGYYGIAAALVRSGLDLMSTGFSAVLLPFISRASAEGGRERVQEIFEASVRFYQFTGIIVAACATLMAADVVHFLYGERYSEVIPALKFMALSGGLTIPFAAYSAIFIALDHHQARVQFVVVSGVIATVSALVFIPWMGYQGALWSNLVGTLLAYLVTGWVAYSKLHIAFPMRQVLVQWLVGACVFWGLDVLIAGHPGLWVSVPASVVFVLAFGVLTVNLGGWTEQDLKMLGENSAAARRLLDRVRLVRPKE